MSYHIYTTDGIILKRTAFGEANIFLHILTEDLGLIVAGARSARLSSSKLRSALQEYTYVSVSCVKGKNGWKITNVVEKENFFFNYPKGKNGWKITNVVEKENFFFNYPNFSHKILSQISSVLLKMIPGESPHKEIFQIVKSGFEFLKTLQEKDVLNFETLVVLRILHQLGYVESGPEINFFLKNREEWNVSILEEVSQSRGNIIFTINKALKESQL